ncbi:MAG: cytochrome c biogenesis protein ResB [Candidatus Cryptobacteroides sp.]
MVLDWFALPVNIFAAILWVVVIVLLWNRRHSLRIAKFFLSPLATILSISLFASGCLVLGILCDRSLVTSWWFVAELFFLMTVLAFVLLRGLRTPSGKIRYGFILNHLGLLIVLISLFFGAPDTDILRMSLRKGEVAEMAWREDGSPEVLGYRIGLESFSTEYFENGVPAVYEAVLDMDGKRVSLKVNSPVKAGFGEQIYLVSAGADDSGCVLQIVRQPWKYMTVTGIVLMLAGAAILFIRGPRRRLSAAQPSNIQ